MLLRLLILGLVVAIHNMVAALALGAFEFLVPLADPGYRPGARAGLNAVLVRD